LRSRGRRIIATLRLAMEYLAERTSCIMGEDELKWEKRWKRLKVFGNRDGLYLFNDPIRGTFPKSIQVYGIS
jgi:hypothetical protein